MKNRLTKWPRFQARRRRRIYIIPTGFGLLYLSGALLMILIGSAYQNNLVNILAFFMLSLVFVAMIQTHNNLKDVTVEGLETEGGFAGGEFLVSTRIANEAKVPRFNIESRLRKIKAVSVYENQSVLPEQGRLRLRAAYPAGRRGRHKLKAVRLSTVFPLGLFEAWTWFNIEADYFVYPEPKGERPVPRPSVTQENIRATRSSMGDDFHGHRRHQLGDSHHHVDWKALARGRPKLVKEFSEGSAPDIAVFDWYELGPLDTESKLSQLAQWIEDARARKTTFALRLPEQTIAPGSGLAHAIRCLEALADFQQGDA